MIKCRPKAYECGDSIADVSGSSMLTFDQPHMSALTLCCANCNRIYTFPCYLRIIKVIQCDKSSSAFCDTTSICHLSINIVLSWSSQIVDFHLHLLRITKCCSSNQSKAVGNVNYAERTSVPRISNAASSCMLQASELQAKCTAKLWSSRQLYCFAGVHFNDRRLCCTIYSYDLVSSLQTPSMDEHPWLSNRFTGVSVYASRWCWQLCWDGGKKASSKQILKICLPMYQRCLLNLLVMSCEGH